MAITIKAELPTSRATKDGKYIIYIRLTKNRAIRRLSTGLRIEKKHWNPKASEVRKSFPKYIVYNRIIQNYIMNIQSEISKNPDIELNILIEKATFKGTDTSDNFFSYANEFINQKEKAGLKDTSIKQMKVAVNKFEKFVGKELKWKLLNYNLLSSFKTHLFSIGNSVNTVENNLRKIRTIIIDGVKNDKLDYSKNPFLKLKLETQKTHRERMTIEEIMDFENIPTDKSSRVDDVKNIFLFQFYCRGMRIGDALCIKVKNYDKEKGRIKYTMRKTGHFVNLKLIDKAIVICNEYAEDKKGNEYLFPFLTTNIEKEISKDISSKTALINRYLGKLSKPDKKITTKIARHSFAAIAKSKIDIYRLRDLLGHADVKTTQRYAAAFQDDELDDAVDEIFD